MGGDFNLEPYSEASADGGSVPYPSMSGDVEGCDIKNGPAPYVVAAPYPSMGDAM
jgi:hypothetical protein